MADISVSREHGLDLDDAKEKVRDIVEDLKSDIDQVDDITWKGDSAADIGGKGFNGEISVDGRAVTLDINLKLFAKPFKGKIQEKIESRMDSYFG